MKGTQMRFMLGKMWILIAACLLVSTLTYADDKAASSPKVAGNMLSVESEAMLKTIPTESIAATGKDGWLFGRSELRYLSVFSKPFWGENAAGVSASEKKDIADPTPAIVKFSDDLKKKNIHLIVVPVPPKGVVYADKLSGKITKEQTLSRLDKTPQEFYSLLREKGVDVLDLTDEFLKSRGKDDDASVLYCRQDTHWSGRACEVAAAALAKMIKSQAWYKDVPKETLASEQKNAQITGDLWIDKKDASLAKETLPLRMVGRKKGNTLEPVESDKNSPVLLMGDSHTLVFHAGDDMLGTQAGLVDQLAYDLGFPVELLGVRGSGATTVRISLFRQAKQGDYLAKKKVIIWCLSERDFTEATSGWRVVPIQ